MSLYKPYDSLSVKKSSTTKKRKLAAGDLDALQSLDKEGSNPHGGDDEDNEKSDVSIVPPLLVHQYIMLKDSPVLYSIAFVWYCSQVLKMARKRLKMSWMTMGLTPMPLTEGMEGGAMMEEETRRFIEVQSMKSSHA
jgi:hypothetical protein